MLRKLKSVGGQNPIEAALKGCKIYHGPFVYNFNEVYEYLKKNNMSFQIKDELDLTKKIISDLKEPKIKNLKNIEKIHTFGQEILKNTVSEINNYI